MGERLQRHHAITEQHLQDAIDRASDLPDDGAPAAVAPLTQRQFEARIIG